MTLEMRPEFVFGDLVLVQKKYVGIVLKSGYSCKVNDLVYKVYVKHFDEIQERIESDLSHFKILCPLIVNEPHCSESGYVEYE